MTVSLSGRLEDFILPQVISLLEVVQASGHLELTSPAEHGQLAFRRGQIVAARLGDRSGEVAAYVLLSWSTGEFRFDRQGPEPEGELGRSNQSLCLEAMRLLDESRNASLRLAAVPGAACSPAGDELCVLSAIRGGASSLRQVARSCQMSALQAYYHFEELERAGAVRRHSDQAEASAALPPDAPGTIRVLIVDDSEFMRRTLTRLFEADPSISVVGAAASGREALALLTTLRPDLITLDLHMPEMDGVATLKRIMLTNPTPTMIVTAASPDALDLAFETILRFGAIDFITKPSRSRGDLDEQTRYILRRMRAAARVNLRGLRLFQPQLSPAGRRAQPGPCQALMVAIGGLGSCLAFMQILSSLPPDLPLGALAVLPFPSEFLSAFASFMNKYSAFEMQVVAGDAPLRSGVCHLTNGSQPLRVVRERDGAVLRASTVHGPCDGNLLLYDASRAFERQTVALLLSSESRDLSAGLAAVRSAGGLTMAQLPETCVDAAGPAQALSQGLIDKVAVPNRLSHDLSQFFIDRLSHAGAALGTAEGAD